MVSEEFMDEIIESEVEQMDENCEKRISGAQEIISSQCDKIEQLKADLAIVHKTLEGQRSINDRQYDLHTKEIQQLKSKLEVAKKGLEFYADDFNWLYNEIKKSDCEEIKAHYVNKRPIPKGLFFEAGGKTARQALKEISEG